MQFQNEKIEKEIENLKAEIESLKTAPISKFSISEVMEDFSNTSEFKQINLDTTENIQTNISKSFTLESGKIKINGDIKIVEISGLLQQRTTGTPYYTVRLYKNNTQVFSIRLYGGVTFQNLMLKNDVVAVEDGDLLHYEVSTSNTSNGVNSFEVIIKEIR